MSIDTLLDEKRVIKTSDLFKSEANTAQQALYQEANENRLAFWENRAKDLDWFEPWDTILQWEKPVSKWFINGKLNASYNCLDRHLNEKKNKTAIIWEGETGEVRSFTYETLHRQVNKLACQLKKEFNIQKGDRVTLYMPMIPELAISVLACARIGAIHSVVFGGFSADSLRERIEDSGSKLLITANGGHRRGQVVPLYDIASEALSKGCDSIENVLVVKHLETVTNDNLSNKAFDYHKFLNEAETFCEPEPMDSEDTLFILYTSGTTGKPKGIVHSTGGYLTHAAYSTKTVFDLKDNDVYWCSADIGWITGHTYLVYGPLANGATVFMYEGSPDYPDKDRFWDIIERHKVSIFYTAPTAIRAFMKWGTEYVKKHDISSLRLLGTVGEPINPEAWMWYYKHIGGENCPIVDTWWQTETGGIMISNVPAINDMKPGYAGPALPGVSAKILDKDGNVTKTGGGFLSLTEPWPSMLRGIWGDEQRFKDTYWSKFDTYFAGDGATVDEDGYFMVLGRVDDVLNVAGHRIGTMEVESSLVDHPSVAEAAVVGMPDEIKGQAILAFVILKEGQNPTDTLNTELIAHVGTKIGAIAKPKKIIFTPELPKTRSGKIMRRILKALAEGKDAGDTTTLGNPDIVEAIKSSL
ncbi:acetate--CoA ligase [Candidatus Marinamargulisbacteria bacterium SCGC AG-439-L15]|nr:acetate--CoA ligase [Candidatus Marinamargulisbacteria bacterium SCGC AG-439-L15]